MSGHVDGFTFHQDGNQMDKILCFDRINQLLSHPLVTLIDEKTCTAAGFGSRIRLYENPWVPTVALQ